MNPFFTDNFTTTWLKYFSNHSDVHSFDSIKPIKFLKSKYGLFYYNIGKNITNGISYQLTSEVSADKGKVLLMYDVLPYQQKKNFHYDQFKLRKVPQYMGYLTDLTAFESFDEYFKEHFSGKSRNNIRKWDKRLNAVCSINFKVFFGGIDKNEFNELFDKLIHLIGKRWGQLGMDNDILRDEDYYRELSYKMILEKTASLNVIYANDKPIAISICFASKEELFFAITTFDTDFRKYNLGHLLIMYILKWCFENGFTVFDYSKGTYDYKTRWSNKSYVFENHILFDKRSLIASSIGEGLTTFFRFKQFLRKKNVNLMYSKLKFLFKKQNTSRGESRSAKITDIDQEKSVLKNSTSIDLNHSTFDNVRPFIFDILFSNPQEIKDVTVHKIENQNKFILQGENLLKEIDLDSVK
ncbi:MAG: GNAT family N-acetyltransferase [Bacteroidota bacterium]